MPKIPVFVRKVDSGRVYRTAHSSDDFTLFRRLCFSSRRGANELVGVNQLTNPIEIDVSNDFKAWTASVAHRQID